MAGSILDYVSSKGMADVLILTNEQLNTLNFARSSFFLFSKKIIQEEGKNERKWGENTAISLSDVLLPILDHHFVAI